MISSTTRIQLIQNPYTVSGTSPIGYLDVAEDVQVPVTYSVADIKDISKRAGTFSKTIKLPGTKNNNRLLGQLYEVNLVQGTFDINRLQYCNLLQNNIPVVENAYLQVVRVNKLQKGTQEDESVEYEVLIKDNASDFFTKLGSRELTDLDFTDMNHTMTANEIVASFTHTSNFPPQAYKYVAPWVSPPSPNSPWYTINDFKPGIFAAEYWRRIHWDAGYTYQWQTAGDPFVQFDRLIIPYTGDDVKITAAANQANAVIAENTSSQFLQTPYGVLGAVVVLGPNNAIPTVKLTAPTEIQDPFSLYTPATSTYTVSTPVAAPDAIDFVFDIEFNLTANNAATTASTLWNPNSSYRPEIVVVNQTTGQILGIAPLAPYTQTFSAGNQPGPGAPFTLLPGPAPTFIVGQIVTQTSVSITNLQAGDQLEFRLRVVANPNGAEVKYYNPTTGGFISWNPRIQVFDFGVTVKYNTDSLVYGSTVEMNSYVPPKIKQSDFIKAICNMYNLYVEPDPNSKNNLIYRHRDDFYDSGALVDWTDKLDRESTQILQFLPELYKKRVILTYKEDKDLFNQVYTDATKEIYGQQEIIFENEYIKDIDKRELLFSPTPVRVIDGLNVVAPLIGGQNPDMNIRILLDNPITAQVPVTPYTIQNYIGNTQVVTGFPMISHLDSPTDPQFDINYGVCDFYFYNIGQYTNNNLYNLFWKRTMGQINNGKMMTANFWLTPADIQKMRLNDKIRIDNSYWNINRIIDYNANARQLTRVELISIDDGLKLPRFGKESTVKPNWFDTVNPAPQDTVLPVTPPKKVIEASNNRTKSGNISSSTINTDRPIEVMGKRTILGTDFTGVVIGDDIVAGQPGYYVNQWALTETGVQITGQTIVDPGADIAIPPEKVDPIDIIDGGLDVVRPYGGAPRTVTTRTYIDGGLDSV